MSHEPSEIAPLTARLNELEVRYTHLQRIVEDLNAVIVSQELRIDHLERKHTLLTGQLVAISEREPETRTLEDEKPPHY